MLRTTTTTTFTNPGTAMHHPLEGSPAWAVPCHFQAFSSRRKET
jgi:hypothetical protein